MLPLIYRSLCRRCIQCFGARPAINVRRRFSQSTCARTDGVFRELAEMRVRTPWIDVLRKKQQEKERGVESGVENAAQSVSAHPLTPKRMADSYSSLVLPLARDRWLSDTYLNSEGNVRLGALFTDLDALSGVVAYKHTGEHVTTVTASFDRISLASPLDRVCDLKLSGQVTHVGRSSMEVALRVTKLDPLTDDGTSDLLNCSCTMVSLDPQTRTPVPINPLLLETEEDRIVNDEAVKNAKQRKVLREKSLIKYTPDFEETKMIHALWHTQRDWDDAQSPLTKPQNVTFTQDTRIHTTSIMQPQYRNRHHFMIFGGFLLRSSYELAFCCCASFSHMRPRFVSLDPSTFERPVPVGSVLYLTATVAYTDPQACGDVNDSTNPGPTRVQVRVDSYVRNIEHVERKPTGTFNYTFEVDRDVHVMPRTYSEFMMYVDARRRARRVSSLDGSGAGMTE